MALRSEGGAFAPAQAPNGDGKCANTKRTAVGGRKAVGRNDARGRFLAGKKALTGKGSNGEIVRGRQRRAGTTSDGPGEGQNLNLPLVDIKIKNAEESYSVGKILARRLAGGCWGLLGPRR